MIVRTLMLRDGLGGRMGTAVVFHPAQSLDALPHGECDDGSSVEASQAELEDRLAAVFDDFRQGGESFGVLWITVDEARELRKTHGAGACEAMLEKVKRAMPRRSGAGATMSFWCCRMSAHGRCWRPTHRCWLGWPGRRSFAGGATVSRSPRASARRKRIGMGVWPIFWREQEPQC